MRDLFYGLHLISAEDIGMNPALKDDEPVDQEHCYALATSWLSRVFKDEDLAVDTRVAVPIYASPVSTRLWLTLGVRLSKLDVSYARPPSLKPAAGGDWKVVETSKLEGVSYLIPVDEFAEVDLPGMKVLTRDELRAMCDREKTKDAILKALQSKAMIRALRSSADSRE